MDPTRTFLVLCLCAPSFAQDAPELPGPRADGSILLPNGWSLRPTGEQLALESDLPVRSAFRPGGDVLAIQHAGYRRHEVALYDVATRRICAQAPLARTWSGMAWNATGTALFVSGGVDDCVWRLEYRAELRAFAEPVRLGVGDAETLDLPAGMTVAADGDLLVVLQRSHRVVRLDDAGEVRWTTDLGAPAFPFECLLDRSGERLFVSLWGARSVAVLDAGDGTELARIACGSHPGEMQRDPRGERLFVSHANENTVSVIDLARQRVEETILSALYPQAPPGSTPNSIALSPDGGVLLIANADNHNAAVIDVRERGRARGLGFVPLGYYPTSIRFTPDGADVIAIHGKGSTGSHANPEGTQPGVRNARSLDEYTGGMFRGSLGRFAFPDPAELARLTKLAYACSPLRADGAVRGVEARPADCPIPAAPGDPTPIRHCIYIIKENRTYDQVLGDDPRGNGDPELCLFPERVTPNHHAIAREFVLLDNFYVEAEVSADGHEWTLGAYATDFVERTWPVTYGGKGSVRVEGGRPLSLGYPAEGNYALARPENGYLWDLARAAGVSYRSYGEFVSNGPTPEEPAEARVEALEGHFDPHYRGYDLDYPDVKRAERFLSELREFERQDELPRLIVLVLPNDHTAGTRAGSPTPRAYVADNDLALGMVLEGLSRSRFWPSMAVFCVEDDAQNGPDHVDAHRSIAFVAGPYVKRGAVVSTLYSTCSMLRTMELILGLPPMSQFDAAARPMTDCFTGTPDLRPYRARENGWPLDEKNSPLAWGSALSEQLDLTKEDAADDLLFNEIIWRSVRGADSPMPTPRRAAFVRVFAVD